MGVYIKGMKMPRGKKNTIAAYSISLPNIDVQNAIVKKIHDIEEMKKKNQKIVDDYQPKLEQILQKYITK